ncbi:MAG: phage portal protein [Elusimicrobiales bacterium]|nr:phage portal protein [Elusimicrobiales bacterium]
MNWLTKVFNRKGRKMMSMQQFFADVFLPMHETQSGVLVNERLSLNLSAVYACTQVLAQTIGSLPLVIYQRTADGKSRAATHPLYRILHDSPNREMTSMAWRQAIMLHLCLWGNHYSEIEFDSDGNPAALWPITPWRVTLKRIDGQLVYAVALDSGVVTVPFRRMLHIKGLTYDGLLGLSPVRAAHETIGLGIGAQKYAAKFFANDARPGGVLEHPGQLSDEAAARLRKSFERTHEGLDNKFRVSVLEEGMKYAAVGVPPEDAQLLETRKYSVSEIARYFRMPLHKISDLERSTNNNIEQQAIEFITDTIRPWLVNIEQELSFKLFSGDYFPEFIIEGLLRGDIKARYEAYAIGRQWGWLSADDIRERENMNKLPDGQGGQYLVPLNMTSGNGGTNGQAIQNTAD